MAGNGNNNSNSSNERAVDKIPFAKKSMAWALKRRRQLMEEGKPQKAQEFMQKWRNAQGD